MLHLVRGVKMSKKMKPKDRKMQILEAALHVAERDGYLKMQRSDIALKAGVTDSLVTTYFKTMTNVRRLVMRHAVKNLHYNIIAQGIANKDAHALKASDEIKLAAIKSLVG